jgi:hypothetical protein
MHTHFILEYFSPRPGKVNLGVSFSRVPGQVSNALGPSLDVVHLSDGLGPVVLVDHSSQELVGVVCSSPAYQLLYNNEDLLVVQDSIDVGDDTII